VSGGLSVGSKVVNVGLQAGLSVADGFVRAGLTGEDYGLADGLLDAGAGAVGEGFGNAARGLASAPNTQIGRSLEQLDRGRSPMAPKAQAAFRGILERRLAQIEGAIAGAASGLAARLGALFRDDGNR